MDKLYRVKFFDLLFIYLSLLIDSIFVIFIIYFSITQFELFYAILLPLIVWALGSNFINKIVLIKQIKILESKEIKIKYLDSNFIFEIANNSNSNITIKYDDIEKVSIDNYGILGFMNFFRGHGSNIGYQNSIVKLGKISILSKDYEEYKLIISDIEEFEKFLKSANINIFIENIETL